MMILKDQRIKSKKHLEFIRSLKCCAESLSCNGNIQAHHLLKPWAGGRGVSLKADDRNVIPLCVHHHAILHTKYGSEKSFFYGFGRDENFSKGLAEYLWKNSPARPKGADKDD